MGFNLGSSDLLTSFNNPKLDEPSCAENDLDINDPECLENDDDYQACLLVLAAVDEADADVEDESGDESEAFDPVSADDGLGTVDCSITATLQPGTASDKSSAYDAVGAD